MPDLSVLIVEDSEDDTELIVLELQREGYDIQYQQITSKEEMLAAMHSILFDVVLCDYKMPNFNGLEALKVWKELGSLQPFIIVSGTIGEEAAVEALKMGANDYVMKDNIVKLGSAVDRALREMEETRKRIEAEQALMESEQQYRTLLSNLPSAVYRCKMDEAWTMLFLSEAIEDIVGYKAEDFIGNKVRTYMSLIFPDDREQVRMEVEKAVKNKTTFMIEYRVHHSNGEIKWIKEKGVGIWDDSENLSYIDGVLEDITPRKEMEGVLIRREEWFRAIFDESPIAINVFDKNGEMVLANRACLDMFGVKATSDFQGLNLFSDPNTADWVKEQIKKDEQARYESAFDFSKVHQDGLYETEKQGIMWLDAVLSPLRYGDARELQGYIVQMQDITSQKQAEEELRSSEKKYSQLFHSTKDAILIRSIDGKMLDVNQSAVDLFGFSRAEFFSMKLTKIASKDTIRQIVGAIDKQGWIKTEAPLRKKSEEIFIADVSSNLVEIDKQKVIQTIVADITERKQAEEILKQSEENFRILAESSLQGISIYQKGRIVYSNQAYADIIGYTIDEILAFEPERIWQIIHPDDVKMLKEVYSKFLEENETSNNLEFRIIHKNGSCRWVGSYFATTNYNGEQAIQIIQIDNTERKEAEKKVEDSRNRAEFFLDLMSHDLSNIHQAVYGIFDLLLIDTNLTNDARELIQEGLYQMIRSNRLIKSVQKFKEIEDAPPELTPTDPFDAVSAALEYVQSDMPYKKLNLKTKNKAGMYKVMANEYLIDVFYAIFHNAMRFDPNSQVDVELSMGMTKDKSKIRIRISDHGTGIPDQTKTLLFGRVSLMRTGYLGTGIGLTLVNRIISYYGGKVYVEDRVPEDYRQGVKFILEIPRASPDSV